MRHAKRGNSSSAEGAERGGRSSETRASLLPSPRSTPLRAARHARTRHDDRDEDGARGKEQEEQEEQWKVEERDSHEPTLPVYGTDAEGTRPSFAMIHLSDSM